MASRRWGRLPQHNTPKQNPGSGIVYLNYQLRYLTRPPLEATRHPQNPHTGGVRVLRVAEPSPFGGPESACKRLSQAIGLCGTGFTPFEDSGGPPLINNP